MEMKLCYIWIEEYRGFINQGFNFSTDFFFSFNQTDSTLIKTPNEKFIKDFFGVQIKDVIGIIGKNASGKTNILELIQYISEGANTIINIPFFVVYKTEVNFIIFNYKLPPIKMDFEAEERNYDGKIPNLTSIFFSNVFDGRRHNFGKKTINISTNDILNSQFGENINKNYQNTIQQQIRFIKSKHFRLLEEIESVITNNRNEWLKPSKVILTSPIWANIIHRVRNFDDKFRRNEDVDIRLGDFVRSFRKKITDNKSINSLKYYSAFLVFIDFILNRDILKYSKSKEYASEREYYSIVISIFNRLNQETHIDEAFEYFTSDFAMTIDKYWNVPETSMFLHDLRDINWGKQSDIDFRADIGTYSNRRIQFTLDYNEKVGSFLIKYLDAVTNLNLAFTIEWAGISSGHKAYINIFSKFYSILSRVREENILICIDEGDLYFHPKWQTEFLYKLITILPKLLNRSCQLILTTHSPFLVSDLPKRNLIFVEKAEDGNLRVISNELIDSETFGGNIGELYLDAFFMQGSLISHFAAYKIQELVKNIRKERADITNDDKILIENIGDDLIKLQIKKLLDDKN